MFVSNLSPVLIVCGAAVVKGNGESPTAAEITRLLQCAMFATGIGTCLQIYPVITLVEKLSSFLYACLFQGRCYNF